MPREGYSDGMPMERLMQSVLGDRYHGLATAYQEPSIFKRDFKKLIDKLVGDIDKLVASENFRLSIKHRLETIKSRIGQASTDDDFRVLLVESFHIVSTLLGYHYQSGKKYEEPYFIPTTRAEASGFRDALGYYEYEDELYDRQKELVLQLKSEGKTYAEISKIMNLSAYRVAQIVRAEE